MYNLSYILISRINPSAWPLLIMEYAGIHHFNTTSFMVVKAFTTDHYTCIAIVGFALNTLLIADKKHG